MDDKYTKTLLNNATRLDAVTDGDGKITKLALSITEKQDAKSTRELCKKMDEIADHHNNSAQIIQIERALKESLIAFYGHLRVQEICSNKKDNEGIEDERSLPELLDELNNLVGLEKVKQQVRDLIAYQKVQVMRKQAGLMTAKGTLHLAFTGNPGTGKTTVARIVGHVYKQIGLLTKGHFIEVSRTDLIAGYQGQTALKVKEVIERAKGGVLFIDEAYSITENDHTDSYGRECLTELTKALEDYRDDLVVIVAGYTEPMRAFFESNPGLKSRFNTFIEFDDYGDDELLDILKKMCQRNDYVLSDDAERLVKEQFTSEVKNKSENFANGRLARNYYDKMIMNQAKRIVDMAPLSKKDLMIIDACDIPQITDDQQVAKANGDLAL